MDDFFEETGSVDIHRGDNLEVIGDFPDSSFDLIFIDPPYNTGKRQKSARGKESFEDSFGDYGAFIQPRLEEARRLLVSEGSLFVMLDARESHYVKVALDGIFGRDCFRNEIVWAYEWGGKPKDSWARKHDVILWYSMDPKRWTFRFGDVDRLPYMAPGLAGAERARRGKTPTDVWWQTIVHTNGAERTGYPTQKPLPILERDREGAFESRRSHS